MLQLALYFTSLFKLVMLELKFLVAYALLGILGWSLVSFILDTVAGAKKMHQIPCTKCHFFTGDYRLKCTVNPHVANTEDAIHCSDYQEQELIRFE